jgi:hypothetical protein
MSALIGALRVSLSADTAAFEQGMARARNTANKTAGGIKGAFGGIGGTLAAAAGGFVAALSIGTIVAAGKAALDYAGHLGELGRHAGPYVERFADVQLRRRSGRHFAGAA